ncbi:hypothetical protein HYE54_03505 [Aggregatibacter actinomycetemcomitans]|uniref:hypothetical protein n=1 Tax=Aggregatibacter actinomycetemcomitans TaxID=714 RepID=UPI00197B5D18|nr:hypothetical protein [Aggregatibacter actinomycetemcomitans]MBN6067852.1 hypothetical protein [Aggregatibacter actinomycetemcomitans]MBN6085789.1 hypothetical protein [Aggregatibacter actinomycetemcomitans]
MAEASKAADMLKEYTEEEWEYFRDASKRWVRVCRHIVGQSEFPVERAFDSLNKDEWELVIKTARIEREHLINPYSRGKKLREYTEEGQRKLADAVRLIRKVSETFPPKITDEEFNKIDKEVNYAKSTY